MTERQQLPAPASLPSPSACHLQRLHGLRSRPLRQRARNGNGDDSVRRRRTSATLRRRPAPERRRQRADAAGYLPSRPRRKMSPGTSLGRSVDSHNPQRVSRSIGASQRCPGSEAAAGAPSEPAARQPAAQMIFNPLLGRSKQRRLPGEAMGSISLAPIDSVL